MKLNKEIRLNDLAHVLPGFWDYSGRKILLIEKELDPAKGAPVFTVNGKYTSRGWTEWTQGFQYGSAILQFEVSGDPQFLEIGRIATKEKMAPHPLYGAQRVLF